MTQYSKLKRGVVEDVQSFSTRFMKVYNAIPDQFKPPPVATKFHYVDAFDNDLSLLLTEIRSCTLIDIMNDAIEVEVNLMAYGKMIQRMETKKNIIKEESQPYTSQSSDAKLDMMLKTMENIVEKLSFDNKPTNKEK